MSLSFDPLAIPLDLLENGAIRVRGTRIPFESLIYEFRNGATPEQIATDFDTLDLADVYTVSAFYLRNRLAVDEYIAGIEQLAGQLRKDIEADQQTQKLTDRFRAIKHQREALGATTAPG